MEACAKHRLGDPFCSQSFSWRSEADDGLGKKGCLSNQLGRPSFLAPIRNPFVIHGPFCRHSFAHTFCTVSISPSACRGSTTDNSSSIRRGASRRRRIAVCRAASEQNAPSHNMDLEMEIFRFMETSGKPDVFPSRIELLRGGRSDLVEAIEAQGGWLSVGWDDEADESVSAVLGSSVPSFETDKGFDMDEFWGEFPQLSRPIHTDTSASLNGTQWSSEASRLAELVGNGDQTLDRRRSKPSSEPGYKGREAAPLGGVIGVDFSRGLQNLPSMGGGKRLPPKSSSDFYSQLDSVTNNLLAGLGLGYASPPLEAGENMLKIDKGTAELEHAERIWKAAVESMQTLDMVYSPSEGVEAPPSGPLREEVGVEEDIKGGFESKVDGISEVVEVASETVVEVPSVASMEGTLETSIEAVSKTTMEEGLSKTLAEVRPEHLATVTSESRLKVAAKTTLDRPSESTVEDLLDFFLTKDPFKPTVEDTPESTSNLTPETTVEEMTPESTIEGISKRLDEETATSSKAGGKMEQGQGAASLPGGTSTTAELQESTSSNRRAPNYWHDPDNMWRELRSAQAELGLADDVMPNRRQLVRLNRHDLVRAVRRQGGFRRMAARLRPGLSSGQAWGSGLDSGSESESDEEPGLGSRLGSTSGRSGLTRAAGTGSGPWLRPGSRSRTRAGQIAEKEVQKAEPKAEPRAEPIAESIEEPIEELIAEPIPEPIAEPIAEPHVEPAPSPEPDPEPDPAEAPQQSPLSRLLNAFGFGAKPETAILEHVALPESVPSPPPESVGTSSESVFPPSDSVPMSYATEFERKAAEEERKALDEQQVAQRLRDSLAPSFWRKKTGRRREGGVETAGVEGEGDGRANAEDVLEQGEAAGIPGGSARSGELGEEETGPAPSTFGSAAVVGDNSGLLARIRELEMNLAATREALQHDREALFENRESLREIRTSTLQELSKVSDSLEFREDEFQKTQRSLRRTQAEMRVLEASENLWVPEEIVPEPQNPEDVLPSARLMRMVRVVWPHEGQEVEVTGSFNNWEKVKMERSNAGVFIATLTLPPGRYEMKFVVDGVWKVDAQRLITYDGGNENNVINVF